MTLDEVIANVEWLRDQIDSASGDGVYTLIDDTLVHLYEMEAER